jgi:hypothetical protein
MPGIVERWKKEARIFRRFNTPEYRSYYSMLKRCRNVSFQGFHRYGGRGIAVCDRWLGIYGFDNFMIDLGHKPDPKMQIGRINNDLGYSPDNCKWVTRIENMRNTTRNRMITFHGETLPAIEWAQRLGLKKGDSILRRIESGWPIEKALTISRLPRGVRPDLRI